MKKIMFAVFTLALLFNLSQSVACDDHNQPDSKPANDQPVKKGK